MSGAFYEFFAGGGMARAGLGPGWTCLFANDFDPKKAASYEANWGASDLKVGDVADLTTKDLPGHADLVWGSFPCQDLSLAGAGAGLKGERSGTFWPFWKLVKALQANGRAPTMIVLENVCGALTSHGGKDFAAIGAALTSAGYRFGAVVIDAVHFLPQSRPRLFIVAVRADAPVPMGFEAGNPEGPWHSAALVEAQRNLSRRSRENWIWWRLPSPPFRNLSFIDILEENPVGVEWHSPEQTRKLLGMMSPVNAAKVREAMKANRRMVGAIYKRTRPNGEGRKIQRAEIRFDDIAGCLRTPAGGSSRQSIMVVDGRSIGSRLLSPREAARLMGLPEDYQLPRNYNEAYHLAGDGVAVPVVKFLASSLLEPLLAAYKAAAKKAA
ncbi:DNA cytosine methyltransferase [Mesorhizobium caraganae]|uniref:DNA cytosine methyltransferase n=1 Tax=Mesorhizobium caraganae TaxID=483206 RepID=UPI00177DD96A|nr:DNA cytosine methyltransferase [Mesorhizobium caraganae]